MEKAMTTTNIFDLIDWLHLFARPEQDYNKHFSYLNDVLEENGSKNLAHYQKLPAAQKIIKNAVLDGSEKQSTEYVDAILGHNSPEYLSLYNFVYENKPALINMQSKNFTDNLGNTNGFGKLAMSFVDANFNEELFSNGLLFEESLNNVLFWGSHRMNQAYKDVLTKMSQHKAIAKNAIDYIGSKCANNTVLLENSDYMDIDLDYELQHACVDEYIDYLKEIFSFSDSEL
jgi:hypothetical protein